MIQYRSIADLGQAIRDNTRKIPPGVELVVGIPRSGLLAATIVALHLNLPLTDLDGFVEGRLLQCGESQRHDRKRSAVTECRKVLVVDDSVRDGCAMGEARKRIESAAPTGQVIYSAVYATPDATDKVDLFFEVCPAPRIFEWNIMHNSILRRSCMDIDGVLCRDPSDEENDDGPRYLEFLETAESVIIPTVTVGYLVTCRLEKYRAQTQRWLQRNGVEYDELIMMDLPSKEARVASGSHAQFKADVYRRTNTALMIESSLKQAVEIADKACKPVFCTQNWELIFPSIGALSKRAARKLPTSLYRRTQFAMSRVGKRLLRYAGR